MSAAVEIGTAATPLRRQGAIERPAPIASALPAGTTQAAKPVRRRPGPVRGTQNEAAFADHTQAATPVGRGAGMQSSTMCETLPAPGSVRHGAIVPALPNHAAPHAKSDQRQARIQAGSRNSSLAADPKPVRRRAKYLSSSNNTALSAEAIAAVVSEIVQLQKIRRFCIKSQSRCDRSIEALIASMMGYRLDMDEKAKKDVFATARKFRVAVESGEGQSQSDHPFQNALSALHPLIAANAAARDPWDKQRAAAEKQMERLVERLPIASFVSGVRGLGLKGTAILIGEAGIPIGDYRTVSGLWKRYGLAVIGGRAQRRATGAAAAEQGFAPARRAEVWAVCSDSLFRAQWRGDRDEDGKDPAKTGKPVAVPAHPIGPYGEVYANRREHTAARMIATDNLPTSDPAKWSKGRCHNDARRVMTKKLTEDIWRAWRREAA